MIRYVSCRKKDNTVIFYLSFSSRQVLIESSFIKEKIPGIILSLGEKIAEKYEINFPNFENYEIIGYNIKPYRCDIILTPIEFIDDIDRISCYIEFNKIDIVNKRKFAAVWLA